ncbi:MAG: NUDIX domain-containing protein [Prevotellaceae bacterium]|jgi:8-oxo-dGTP pyrophosphatase MutT (NUDIX family)|nr:NUDIX domain-containing protein [Prevotellaceae bacterium]
MSYKVFCDDRELQVGESEWLSFCSRYQLVEAAGGLVRSGGGECLMIFRNGRWDLPKGKREEGESVEQTALREVMEECGVGALTLQGLLTVTYHTYTLNGVDVLKRTYWYAMRYAGSLRALQPQAEEGIEVAEFLPPEKVAACLEASYGSIREVFAAEKAKR